jgi:hypothetical protein
MARSEDFAEGSERARRPQFQSVQQMSNRNFQAISVLDNVIPNPNGMGQPDLQRRLVGSQGSASGRAQSTFDRQLWLKHPEPANRTRTLEGQN